jgi:hypothetical protein
MAHYSVTARCSRWGSKWGARQVTGLTAEEREMVRRGEEVRMDGCPPAGGNHGTTERVVVEKRGCFYTRVS